MHKKYNIFIVFLVITYGAFCCLNGETQRLKNGIGIYRDEKMAVPFGHRFLVSNYDKVYKELDSLYQKTGDIDYLSDKGYVLILQGEYKKALKLYFEIEKRKPNRYSTASNLGTIYELIGDNTNALKWINKSIKIDANSHKGSEWLHAKILEAKIKGAEFYTGTFLINTDFGRNSKPKTNLSQKQLLKLDTAIYYQLNERVSFIKPKDKIIAVLMFELGNIYVLTNNIHDGRFAYERAKHYGFEDEEFINKRLKYVEQLIDKEEQQRQQILKSEKIFVQDSINHLTDSQISKYQKDADTAKDWNVTWEESKEEYKKTQLKKTIIQIAILSIVFVAGLYYYLKKKK